MSIAQTKMIDGKQYFKENIDTFKFKSNAQRVAEDYRKEGLFVRIIENPWGTWDVWWARKRK